MKTMILVGVILKLGWPNYHNHKPACWHARRAKLATRSITEAGRIEYAAEVKLWESRGEKGPKPTQLPFVLIASVFGSESGFDPNAVGAKGEIGYGQIHPKGNARKGATIKQLRSPVMNARLAIRHMYRLRRLCGGGPLRWLSPYSNRPCGKSSYSEKIIERIRERVGDCCMNDDGTLNDCSACEYDSAEGLVPKQRAEALLSRPDGSADG